MALVWRFMYNFFSMLQVRKISASCEDGGTCGWEVWSHGSLLQCDFWPCSHLGRERITKGSWCKLSSIEFGNKNKSISPILFLFEARMQIPFYLAVVKEKTFIITKHCGKYIIISVPCLFSCIYYNHMRIVQYIELTHTQLS